MVQDYNDNRQALYDAVSKDFGDAGTFEEFNEKLDNPENVEMLYNAMSSNGYEDIGTLDDFRARVAKPKEQEQPKQVEQPKQEEKPVAEQPKEKPQQPELTDEQKQHWDNVYGEEKEQLRENVAKEVGKGREYLNEKETERQAKIDEDNEPLNPNAPGVSMTKKQFREYMNEDVDKLVNDFIGGKVSDILKAYDEAGANYKKKEEDNSKYLVGGRDIRYIGRRQDKAFAKMREETIALREANEARQAEYKKQIEDFRERIKNLTGYTVTDLGFGCDNRWDKNPESLESAKTEEGKKYIAQLKSLSNRYGIPIEDLNEYVAKAAIGNVEGGVLQELIERNLPKNNWEYVARGFENSVLGNLNTILTPEQYAQRQYANEMYAKQHKLGLGWKGASFAAGMTMDAPIFYGLGSFSSKASSALMNRWIGRLAQNGMSRLGAANTINATLANQFLRRFGARVAQNAIETGMVLPTYNMISTAAQLNATGQFNTKDIDEKEEWDDKKKSEAKREQLQDAAKEILSSGADGMGMAMALSITGGFMSSWTNKLSGTSKLFGKAAEFGVESLTFASTVQIEKLMHGQDVGSFGDQWAESAVQLLFMKGTSPTAITKLIGIVRSPKSILEADMGDFQFNKEEIQELKDYGKDLFDVLSKIEYYNGRTQKAEQGGSEGEQKSLTSASLESLRKQLGENYKTIMADPNVSWTTKQKLSAIAGGYMDTNVPMATRCDANWDGEANKGTVTLYGMNGMKLCSFDFTSKSKYDKMLNDAQTTITEDNLRGSGLANPILWNEVQRQCKQAGMTQKEYENAQRNVVVAYSAKAKLEEALNSDLSGEERAEKFGDPEGDYEKSMERLGENEKRVIFTYADLVVKEAQREESSTTAKEESQETGKQPAELELFAENEEISDDDSGNGGGGGEPGGGEITPYDMGYEAKTPQGRAEVRRRYEEARKNMEDKWSEGFLQHVDDNPEEALTELKEAADDPNEEDVTPDDYAETVEYVLSKKANEGLDDALEEEQQQAVNDALAIIDEQEFINSDGQRSGVLKQVKLKDGREAYVTSGDVVVDNENGQVNTTLSDETLTIRNEDGTIEMISPNDIEIAYLDTDKENLVGATRENVAEAVWNRQIAEIEAARKAQETQIPQQDLEPEQPTTESENAAETQPATENTTETIRKKPQEPEKNKPSALEQIPKDSKGEPLFDDAENAEIAWDALVEYAGNDTEMAQSTANDMVKIKQDELKRVEKEAEKPVKAKTPTAIIAERVAKKEAIERAQGDLDFWQAVSHIQEVREQEAARIAKEERERAAEEERKKAEEQANIASSNGGETTQKGEELADNAAETESVSESEQKGEEDKPNKIPTLEEVEEKIRQEREERHKEYEERDKKYKKRKEEAKERYRGEEIVKHLDSADFSLTGKDPKDLSDLDIRIAADDLQWAEQIIAFGGEPSKEDLEDIKRLRNILKEAGIEIVDRVLQPIKYGEKIKIKDNEYDPDLPDNVTIVTHVVEPELWKNGKLYKKAKVRAVFGSEDNEERNERLKARLKEDVEKIKEKQERGERLKSGELIKLAAQKEVERMDRAKAQTTEQPSPTQEAIQEVEKEVNTNPTPTMEEAGREPFGDRIIVGAPGFGPHTKKGGGAPVKKVDVEGLFNDLKTKGKTKLSDHAKDVDESASSQNAKEEKPKEEVKKENPKFASDERMEDLIGKIKGKFNNLYSGIDPELLAYGLELTAGYIYRGVKSFGEYARKMIEVFGDVVRPYLRAFYNGVRDMPEIVEEGLDKEMTPYDEVSKFDVTNFDKKHRDVLETAENIAKENEVAKQAAEIKKQEQPKKQEKQKPEFKPLSKYPGGKISEGKIEGEKLTLINDALKKSVDSKTVQKFNIQNFCRSKKDGETKLPLEGVYYKDGYMYASSGRTLIKVHTDYPKKYEGKIINPKTNKEIEGNYPNANAVINGFFYKDGKYASVDPQYLLDQIAKAKSIWVNLNDSILQIPVLVDVSGCDGEIVSLSAPYLNVLVDVIKNAKAPTAFIAKDEKSNGQNMLYVVGDGVVALCSPYIYTEDVGYHIMDGNIHIGEASLDDVKTHINGNDLLLYSNSASDNKFVEAKKENEKLRRILDEAGISYKSEYEDNLATKYSGKTATERTAEINNRIAEITEQIEEIDKQGVKIGESPERTELADERYNLEQERKNLEQLVEMEAKPKEKPEITGEETLSERADKKMTTPLSLTEIDKLNPLVFSKGWKRYEYSDRENRLYCEGGYLVATNGHKGIRIRVDYPIEWEGKLFRPDINRVVDKDSGRYPNLSAVIDKALSSEAIKKIDPKEIVRKYENARVLSHVLYDESVDETPIKVSLKGEGLLLEDKNVYSVENLGDFVNVIKNSKNPEAYMNSDGMLIVVADGVEAAIMGLDPQYASQTLTYIAVGDEGVRLSEEEINTYLPGKISTLKDELNKKELSPKEKSQIERKIKAWEQIQKMAVLDSEDVHPPVREEENEKNVAKESEKNVSSQKDNENTNPKEEENGPKRINEVRPQGLSADGNIEAKLNEGRSEASGQESVGSNGGGVQERSGDVRQGVQSAVRLDGQLKDQGKNKNNYTLDENKNYVAKSVDKRIDDNLVAIETRNRLLESGQAATPKDKEKLAKFSGWGGLTKVFEEGPYYNPNPQNKRLRELVDDEVYEAAKKSALSDFYTERPEVNAMWQIARALGFDGGSFLESAGGIGNIIGRMPIDIKGNTDIVAIELDPISGSILSLLHPDAKVYIQGFETVKLPNGSFVLVMTNVPFGKNMRVFDESGDKDLSKRFHNIHDYYIAKNIRKLQEGGLGIFISTSGTLDDSRDLRDWIVSEGNTDFLGAFRLNNKTFKGTDVTADIIVMRKRINGKKDPYAVNMLETGIQRVVKYTTTKSTKDGEVEVSQDRAMDINKYFIEHPEHMGGEMFYNFEKEKTYRETSKSCYSVPGINQEERLAQFVKDMGKKRLTDENGNTIIPKESNNIAMIKYENLGDGVTEGTMFVNDKGQLCVARFGQAEVLNVNTNKIKGYSKEECFNDYKTLKDAVNDVIKYERENEDNKGLKPLLKDLNDAYDSFVEKYGNLQKNPAISFLKNDIDFYGIAALEDFKESNDAQGNRVRTYSKTDIFKERVIQKQVEPKLEDIKDGVVASMNKNGRIDIPYIAKQLGKPEDKVKQEILDKGLGFENPTTLQVEPKHVYLSGNVKEKLESAKENNIDGKYDNNIKALEKAIIEHLPEIPAHLIDFTLGSSWVDPKLFIDYYEDKTGVDVSIENIDGTWLVTTRGRESEKNKALSVYSDVCSKRIWGDELITAAMQNKTIRVSISRTVYKGGKKTSETIVDNTATLACAEKISEIREDFKEWATEKLGKDPELSKKIAKTYNDQFNNTIPLRIPDEYVPKYFVGASHAIELREHQAKAAIRATMQNLLFAHEVGSGKTFTLITTAMEARRLGTANKPLIVVQNSTIGQFVASAKFLYPGAKILTLEEADRTVEGRKAFYAKIKYNDWDIVVIPQSTFDRIPDSKERQLAYIQDRIDEKMHALEQMRNAKVDDKAIKRAENEIENMKQSMVLDSPPKKKKDVKKEAKARSNAEARAKIMLDRKVDDDWNFDQLGFDFILVDEAHEYKKLGFATAMTQGVKGVDPAYSQRAQGLFLKIRSVWEKTGGKNVVLATGTPVSNTAAEVWTFMKYLIPDNVLKDYGIYYFDDFVRNFGNIQQMLEFTTSGKFKENNRFAGYVNLPELARIFCSVSDIVLSDEIKDLKEKLPEIEGGKEQDIYLPQTRSFRSVMNYVRKELEKFDNMSGKEKRENRSLPLRMYAIAKSAAIDARLVLNDAADEPQSKTNEAVRQTLKSLEETKDYQGAVAIFADNYQNKNTGFNLYKDIKKKLIDAGVPEEQVAIINSRMSQEAKTKTFEKVNEGKIRVVMGSSSTLGTGVNIQERLHTLIHVDAPDRPMDYTQRNGRLVRQGNLHNKWGIPVRILRFGVEDSLDVTTYQRLKTKSAIANSIMNSRTLLENPSKDRVLEEEEDVFGDTVAHLSGSQYALLKNQAEREVRKLTNRKKQHENDQIYIYNEIPRLEKSIKSCDSVIERSKEGLEKLKGVKDFSITVNDKRYADVAEMEKAEFFKNYNSKVKATDEKLRKNWGDSEADMDIAINVGGFDFNIHTHFKCAAEYKNGSMERVVNHKTTYSCPELKIKDEPIRGYYIKTCVEDILTNWLTGKRFNDWIDIATSQKEGNIRDLAIVREREGKPFEDEELLQQAKERLEEYTQQMKKELDEINKKYKEMDATVDEVSVDDITEADEGDEETGGDGSPQMRLEDEWEELPEAPREAGELAVDRLRDAGIEVITDKEEFEKVKDGEELTTANGKLYGFVKDGKVYLDPDVLDANTPCHEYTHLWDKALQKSDPKKWEEGKALLKQTPLWDKVKNDPKYKKIADDEDEIASEVHSRLVGEKGEGVFEDMFKDARKTQGVFEKAEKYGLINRIRHWVSDVWNWLKNKIFGKKKMTLDDFINAPLKDLFGGKKINTENGGEVQARMEDQRPKQKRDWASMKKGVLNKNEYDIEGRAKVADEAKDDAKINDTISKVMRAQREYDYSTVKSLTDIAREMIADGSIDKSTITLADIDQILSAVKHATTQTPRGEEFKGKKMRIPRSGIDTNVRNSVNRLVEVMQKNQLKKARRRFTSLVEMKGVKIGDDRIKKQKDLDVYGQNLTAKLRSLLKDKSVTLDTIGDKLFDAEVKLNDSNENRRNEAEYEWTALEFTRQYLEYIQEATNRLGEAKDILEQAKKDNASREELDAIRDRIYEARQTVINQLNGLSDRLASELGDSAKRAKQNKQELKKHINELAHYVNSDLEGRGDASVNFKLSKAQKALNNPIVRVFSSSLPTFTNMLRLVGAKAENGHGYTYEYFVNKGVDASNNEFLGTQAAKKKLDDKTKEIYEDSGLNIKRFSDLQKITHKTADIKLKITENDEAKEYDATVGNLLYVYMVDKMSDGRMKLREMGIDEEQIEEIENSLDSRLLDIADWVQDEFLPELRDKYNEVHERLLGASMENIENYFPLVINRRARHEKVDIENDPDEFSKPSSKTGAIKQRRVNILPLDVLGTDAVDVLFKHIEDMEHWAAYSEYNRDINILLSNLRLRNKIESMSSLYGSGTQLWKTFNDVAKLAGGFDYPVKSGSERFAVNLAKGVSRAQIGCRIYTALKQVLSAPAFIPYVRIDYGLKAMINPFGCFKWAKENLPLFSKRWQSRQIGDTRLKDTDGDWSFWNTKVIDTLSKISMMPNVFIDAMTIAVGSKAAYDTLYNRYHNQYRMSEAEAKERALKEASVIYNESQQSSEGIVTAPIQNSKTWYAVAITTFRNASMSYTRQVYDAARNIRRRMRKGYRDESIDFMTKKWLRTWNYDPETATEEQKDRARYAATKDYNRGCLRDLLRLSTFAFLLPIFWNIGKHALYYLEGDDEEKKKDMLHHDIVQGLAGGPIEGLPLGDWASDLISAAIHGDSFNDFMYYNLPAISEAQRVLDYSKTDGGAAANALINLCLEIGVGINPQTVEEMGLAIYDACGQDYDITQEATIFVARILCAPQSQIEGIYFDEIGAFGSEARGLTPAQLAERYAEYRFKRNSFLTQPFYSDEKEANKKEKYIKRGEKEAKRVITMQGDEDINRRYGLYEEKAQNVSHKISEINKLKNSDIEEYKKQMTELAQSEDYAIYKWFNLLDSDVKKNVNTWIKSKDYDEVVKAGVDFLTNKEKLVNKIDSVVNAINK